MWYLLVSSLNWATLTPAKPPKPCRVQRLGFRVPENWETTIRFQTMLRVEPFMGILISLHTVPRHEHVDNE